jgi:hypothetical protein
MSYTIELEQCHSVMRRIARAVKDKYAVDDNEIIWPHITREYGITVKYRNLLRDDGPPTTVTFPSERLYTFLQLKYS